MKTKLKLHKTTHRNSDSDSCCCYHCRSSVLFPGSKPHLCQQYFRSWNRAFQLVPMPLSAITMILNVVFADH